MSVADASVDAGSGPPESVDAGDSGAVQPDPEGMTVPDSGVTEKEGGAAPGGDPDPELSGPELEQLLTNDEIWSVALGLDSQGVGECRVEDSTAAAGSCDYYVKAAAEGTDGDFGWPKSAEGTGTGCVYGPNFGKMQSTCFYPDHEAELCTPDIQTNAVNAIRDALRNDQCGEVGRLSDYR